MAQQEIITAAHWGALKVQVSHGKIVRSENALANGFSNELQTVVHEQVYSQTRIKYPMVRQGYLNGNSDRTLRGKDEWVRVSWDEALNLVHSALMSSRQQYGAQSIFGGSYGWKSASSLHSSQTLLHRYLNLTGGFVGSFSDYSTCAAQRILPYVVGNNEVYEQTSSWQTVLESAEIVVLWSANPIVTLRHSWTATDQQGLDYFEQLKKSGKRIICIDPIRTESCDYLNAEWIPCYAATDVALMLGIAYTLVDEHLADRHFLQTYTQGYDIFEHYLLGKTDNQPKDPQWASQICGVPPYLIRQLARDFSQHRTMLMAGWGMQRQQYGEQAPWMLVTLAAMLGQIGLAGGGFGFSYVNGNGGVPRSKAGSLGKMQPKPADFQPHFSAAIPVSKLTDALLNPNQTIDFNGEKITYPDIKLIYWAGGNPLVHHHDINRMIQAWQKPDCIIVNEINWTPTARMADIVLPVTTSFERNDLILSGSFSAKHLIPMKQVVEPQFESRNDYAIFAALSALAGVEKQFTEDKTELDWLKTFYLQLQVSSQQNHITLPDFEQFWQTNQLIEFEDDPLNTHWVKYQQFRHSPENFPLNTASGKIEIYSETIAQMGYADCCPHPTWFAATEFVGNTTAQYPLTLITPHTKYRLHSQLAHTSLRQKYAVNDREPVLIHPEDANARGIVNGDIVRIESPRGQVLAGAVVTDGIIKGTIALHEGAWYDPLDLGESEKPLCKNGCPNVLTRDEGTSKLAQGNSPNTCIVQVEKFQGNAPRVTVFEQPKQSA